MNTYANASTASTPTLADITKVCNEFKRRAEIRATIELAKREGVVYVGPGIEDADIAKFLPGVEVRHVPYMEKGQVMALDMSRLDPFMECFP